MGASGRPGVGVVGELDLTGADLAFLPAGSTPGRGSQAIDGAPGHQRVLKPGDGSQNPEEHVARCGVGALVEHH